MSCELAVLTQLQNKLLERSLYHQLYIAVGKSQGNSVEASREVELVPPVKTGDYVLTKRIFGLLQVECLLGDLYCQWFSIRFCHEQQ